jgi:YjjG family noncanonical pyrimidine nucleotidase
MTYTWLFFDADGTLFDYDKAERLALERTLGEFGFAMAPATLQAYHRFNQQVWTAFEQGTISSQELRMRRFELLFQETGVPIAPSAFSDLYLQNLSQVSELLPGAQEVVEALHGRYQMAVVTNGLHEVQRPRLERSTVGKYFSALIISEEVGAAKPDPAYFEAAFRRIGNPPKAGVLLIGDNWSSDIEGGNRYGLDTCWYNPGRQPRRGPVRYEISSLLDLLTIL